MLSRLFFGIASPLAPGLAAQAAEKLFFTPVRHRIPEAEAALLATGHRFTIPVHGGRIVAWDWAARGPGAPLVYLLHGWAGRAGQMTPLVNPLLDAGFGVIAFDAHGHGASDGTRSSLVDFAGSLRAVVRWCGPADALVGHSMGGAAIALALHQGLKARRAAFIGTPADPTEFSLEFQKMLGIGDAAMRRMRERAEARLKIRWSELGIESVARTSQVPLLVVHDENDKEVALRDAHRIAASWPDSRVEITQGLGHRRILRDPAVAKKIARFLGEEA